MEDSKVRNINERTLGLHGILVGLVRNLRDFNRGYILIAKRNSILPHI